MTKKGLDRRVQARDRRTLNPILDPPSSRAGNIVAWETLTGSRSASTRDETPFGAQSSRRGCLWCAKKLSRVVLGKKVTPACLECCFGCLRVKETAEVYL